MEQRVMGWILVVVFVPVVIAMLAVGWILDGWDAPEVQCIRGPAPAIGGPFYETTRVTGQPTFFPLGLDCGYDVDGDGIGPQTVHNVNWPNTVVLAVSVFAVGAGGVLIRRGSVAAN